MKMTDTTKGKLYVIGMSMISLFCVAIGVCMIVLRNINIPANYLSPVYGWTLRIKEMGLEPLFIAIGGCFMIGLGCYSIITLYFDIKNHKVLK